ncbi:MAG TPA: hypothetical protein VI248_29335 [Kineosporiaceae bacterium]
MISTATPARPGAPAPPWRRAARWAARHPWVLTAVLCSVVLALPMSGPDLAAQEFRTWLFRRHGALLWDNQWYGGHLLPGYSLLFPPLASVIGTRLLGAVACVWASAAADALLGGARAERGHRLASLWFAIALVGELIIGQLPFAVGFALALTALLAAQRFHPWVAAVTALAASLASPLAGSFLLMAALAWVSQAGWRRVLPLGAAAGGVLVAALLGGGGSFPFPAISLLTVLLFAGGGLALAPRMPKALRWGLLIYGMSSIALFAVPNPAGGNAARLGALAGGPLAAVALGRQGRWRTLAVAAVPLLAWQMWPVGKAVAQSVDDPSSRPEYYTGLDAFLRTQDPTEGRLEIPTLRQHWEASYVAPVFPLARGWERQIDIRYNGPLYDPALTGEGLHRWALDAGITLIALPDAPLDPWSVREAALLSAGQPWLTPVWRDEHWQVWRITDGVGMINGPARLTWLGINSAALSFRQAGTVVVKVRWSTYWQVTAGTACVAPSPEGWLAVTKDRPGNVSLAALWSLSRMTGSGNDCAASDGPAR